jgi:hypothetical protein
MPRGTSGAHHLLLSAAPSGPPKQGLREGSPFCAGSALSWPCAMPYDRLACDQGNLNCYVAHLLLCTSFDPAAWHCCLLWPGQPVQRGIYGSRCCLHGMQTASCRGATGPTRWALAEPLLSFRGALVGCLLRAAQSGGHVACPPAAGPKRGCAPLDAFVGGLPEQASPRQATHPADSARFVCMGRWRLLLAPDQAQ